MLFQMQTDVEPPKEASLKNLGELNRALWKLFQDNPLPCWIFNRKTLRFIEVNHSAMTRYGYTRPEFLSMTILDIRPEEDILGLREHLARHADKGEEVSSQWRHRAKDGQILDVNITAFGFEYNEIPARMVVVHDITEEKKAIGVPVENNEPRLSEESGNPVSHGSAGPDIPGEHNAEQKLRQINQYLMALIENAPALIYVATKDSRLTLVNSEWERVVEISRDDAVGRNLHEIFPPEIANQYESANLQVVRTGLPGSFTEDVVTPHKHRYFHTVKFPIRDEAGEITSVGGISVDITDQHELENERLKLGKFEAVGRLAGGIAHDFNNLLSIILGNVSLLLRAGDLPPATRHRLSTVESACRRTTSLTQQLLTFARGGDPVLLPTSLGNLIREVVEFSLHGTAVEAVFDLDDDLATVDVDSGQMGQVFQNLALNARDAMPQGGHLHIVAQNVSVKPGKHSPAPGDYVRITVTDTGTGMPKKTAEHIFDPYFTTKTEGHGLGLSVVHSIIKRHSGHIRVQSDLGVGTTFEIHLPVTPQNTSGQLRPEEKRSFNPAGLSVLVLEDDKDVRDFMEAALYELGCRTTLSCTGEETIHRIEEALRQQRPFSLVFLDATVRGGKGGRELIHLLRDRIPDLPAVLCSGYAKSGEFTNYRELGFQALLPKPFTLGDLEMAIMSALVGPVES